MTSRQRKPQIDYPCFWDYKVIGSDKILIPQNIEIILENFDFKQSESKKSSTGKYTSFSVSVFVENESERDHIFTMLQRIPTVRMVL